MNALIEASRALAAEHRGDTVIGPDVWIGTEARLMPGITIGAGAIIAALEETLGVSALDYAARESQETTIPEAYEAFLRKSGLVGRGEREVEEEGLVAVRAFVDVGDGFGG